MNAATIRKTEAQTGKYEAETGKIDEEAGRQDLEFIARFAGDRGAVLGTFAKWSEKMPNLAPIAERLAGIQDPEQFKAEVQGFAMSTLDRMEEARAERNSQSLIGYRESMLGKPMVVQTPGGAYTYDPQNPAGGATPMPGMGDPRADAVVHDANKAWLKEQDKSGAAAENLSGSIEQAKALLASPAGVLGSGPMDRAAYGLHQLGVNNSEAAVNTERLREIGAAMTLSFGSLGSQVSNADRETYQRAQGDFERAKSIEAMQMSLKTMAEVSRRVMDKVNQNRAIYEATGRKPDFAPAKPYGAPANLPPPQAPTMEPGADPGVTPQEVEAEMRRRGLLQ